MVVAPWLGQVWPVFNQLLSHRDSCMTHLSSDTATRLYTEAATDSPCTYGTVLHISQPSTHAETNGGFEVKIEKKERKCVYLMLHRGRRASTIWVVYNQSRRVGLVPNQRAVRTGW